MRDELIEMERYMNIRLQSFVRVGDLKVRGRAASKQLLGNFRQVQVSLGKSER